MLKQQIIREWEQVRWLGLKMLEPYLGKNNHITVKDICPLPTDEGVEYNSDVLRKYKVLKEKYKKNKHL